MIEYSNFQEYDNLNKLDIKFTGKPVKDLETDIYKVYLETPIIFALPKSKLEEIAENEYELHTGTYILNDEPLKNFLSNLDAYIINVSNKYSLKWFGKNLDQSVLIRFYENLYNIENDQTKLNFYIRDEDIVDEISNYNIDDDQQIILEVNSVEIYKRVFKLCLNVHSLEYTGDEVESELEDDIDFVNLIDSQKNLCETNIIDDTTFSDKSIDIRNLDDGKNSTKTEDDEAVDHGAQEEEGNATEEEDGNVTEEEDGIAVDHGAQEEDGNTTNHGAQEEDSNANDHGAQEEDGNTSDEDDLLNTEMTSLNADRKLREEVIDLIKNREEEAKTILTNSERIENATQSLKSRASDIDDELRSYREQLKNLN